MGVVLGADDGQTRDDFSLIAQFAGDPGIDRIDQHFGVNVGDFGGPGRDRTDDLFHAMEARSQLRHRPTCKKIRWQDLRLNSRPPRSRSQTGVRDILRIGGKLVS